MTHRSIVATSRVRFVHNFRLFGHQVSEAEIDEEQFFFVLCRLVSQQNIGALVLKSYH